MNQEPVDKSERGFPAAARPGHRPRPDWVAFGGTSLAALIIYLATLAPEVTLVSSGIFAVSGNYVGIADAPGFPLWTLYAWLFAHFVPLSNVAFRVTLSSAVAAALTCGFVSLAVTGGGAHMLACTSSMARHTPTEARWLARVCGFASGMAIGLDRAFWSQAVIVETTALAMMLFSIVLHFLLRWEFETERGVYFGGMAFTYGLTLTVHLHLAAAAPSLALAILVCDRPLGRDLLFTITVIIAAVLGTAWLGWLPQLAWSFLQLHSLALIYLAAGICAAIGSMTLIIITKQLLTRWRCLVTSGILLGLSLSIYFGLPLASTSNPPANTGYTRTVEGFDHVLSRGKYDSIRPVTDAARYFGQLVEYCRQSARDFGAPYFFFALVAVAYASRMDPTMRRRIGGLMFIFLFVSVFLLAMLNPGLDRSFTEFVSVYFVPSHLVAAILAGYGMCWVGAYFGRFGGARLPPSPDQLSGSTKEH